MPYKNAGFRACFKKINFKNIDSFKIKSNSSLKKFAAYMEQDDFLKQKLDVKAFQVAIEAGLYFESNIPQGYGLGSSGALVAAIYDSYFVDRKKNMQYADLQVILAILEGYFHGKSSGFDPVVCYLDRAILKSSTSLEILELDGIRKADNAYQLFLLNTQKARKTEPLVQLFLDKCKKDKIFKQLCAKELVLYNDNCIEAYLTNNEALLWENMRNLSAFQAKYFGAMIPDFLVKIWQEGLESNDFYLKLCGAGGGGFMLGLGKREFLARKKRLMNMEIHLF